MLEERCSKMGRAYFFIAMVAFFLLACGNASADAKYKVGVYYYPGWKANSYPQRPDPWEPLRKFPDREPLLGWYREGDVSVLDQQLRWMGGAGINLMLLDWYWAAKNKPRLNHVLDSYLSLPDRHGVDLAILWANHTEVPESLEQFDGMVDYWLSVVFMDKSYYLIDHCPVVVVFSPERLDLNANKFGLRAGDLLARARRMAVAAGYSGIYFVAASQGIGRNKLGDLKDSGYDAISAYNYHFGYSGGLERPVASHSFIELDEGYRESWSWIVHNSPLPYITPVSSGWDSRPWGGSADPLHDNSASDVTSFRGHLLAAKKFIDSNKGQVLPAVFICCWNEFGEGSYVEPTKSHGFQYINVVSEIFK